MVSFQALSLIFFLYSLIRFLEALRIQYCQRQATGILYSTLKLCILSYTRCYVMICSGSVYSRVANGFHGPTIINICKSEVIRCGYAYFITLNILLGENSFSVGYSNLLLYHSESQIMDEFVFVTTDLIESTSPFPQSRTVSV